MYVKHELYKLRIAQGSIWLINLLRGAEDFWRR